MSTTIAEVAALVARQPRILRIPAVEIDLFDGERYAGLALDKDGAPSHHLILLAGAFEGNWKASMDWAAAQGGDLPTRQEQSLLYANLKVHFERDCYWSNQQHTDTTVCAWLQLFVNGHQYYIIKSASCRERAVRRLVILVTP